MDQNLAFNDMIWKLRRLDGAPCWLVLLVEFQSSTDHDMAFRFYYYDALILRRMSDEGSLPKKDGKSWLPPILFIVLYNGLSLWTAPTRLIDLYYPGSAHWLPHLPNLEYIVIDVHRLAADSPGLRESLMGRVARLEQVMRLRDVDAALEDLEQAAERVQFGLYQAVPSNLRKSDHF